MIDENKLNSIRDLVGDCMYSNNVEILAQIIYRLEIEYKEIATLSTYGEYEDNWTHKQTLDYITYET